MTDADRLRAQMSASTDPDRLEREARRVEFRAIVGICRTYRGDCLNLAARCRDDNPDKKAFEAAAAAALEIEQRIGTYLQRADAILSEADRKKER